MEWWLAVPENSDSHSCHTDPPPVIRNRPRKIIRELGTEVGLTREGLTSGKRTDLAENYISRCTRIDFYGRRLFYFVIHSAEPPPQQTRCAKLFNSDESWETAAVRNTGLNCAYYTSSLTTGHNVQLMLWWAAKIFPITEIRVDPRCWFRALVRLVRLIFASITTGII